MHPPVRIDLYSDTNTKPSPAMRRAMAEAEVGNEQAGEDPTVNKLCRMTAELLGKEDAVFLPSGTMCNQIALRVWCEPGDEVILDRIAHPANSEAGGPSAMAGASMHPIDGDRGMFTADQVRAAIREPKRNAPRSRVLAVENTVNFGGGAVWPLRQLQEVCAVAKERGLKTHMDGARLMNAVVASGVSAKEFAAPCDSAWIDLSKGLGCPVGAVLAGSREFVDRAWRFKHQWGGAMRQAGIIAAAGVYALEHNVARLAEDHANARSFARAIAQIPGVRLCFGTTESNIVLFDVSGTGKRVPEVAEKLRARGVRMLARNEREFRAVFHLDVDARQTEEAAQALREALAN
jgi:threonine aldolase